MREIRVIGVPRSGTNLMKYLLETNEDVKCLFNHGWWKHAIIPPLMNGLEIRHDTIPTVIMFREPLQQVASFYNFSRKGRTALSGANDFKAFIASQVNMTPGANSFEYSFASPVEYWRQFYYAAIHWRAANKKFVDLADLQEDPSIISELLREFFPEWRKVINPRLPEGYLGRNPDRHVSEGWTFEPGTTLKQESMELASLIESLLPAEVTQIVSGDTASLYDQLRRMRLIKAAS